MEITKYSFTKGTKIYHRKIVLLKAVWTQWDAEKQQLTLIEEMGLQAMLEGKNCFQIINFKIATQVKGYHL